MSPWVAKCKGTAAAAAAKLLQSCPTLCDTIDSSPPGSPVPGILQARTLEWVAISFSNAWKYKVKVKSLCHVWLLAPHGLQPTRLLRPWDFPGKNIGVGCHFLLHTKALGGTKNNCVYSWLGQIMDKIQKDQKPQLPFPNSQEQEQGTVRVGSTLGSERCTHHPKEGGKPPTPALWPHPWTCPYPHPI